MIKSFRNKNTETFCTGGAVRQFQSVPVKVLARKLTQLDSAGVLGDLRVPPGNKLEALQGDRKGQHSIRVNDQWRLCFVWDDGVTELELVDYH